MMIAARFQDVHAHAAGLDVHRMEITATVLRDQRKYHDPEVSCEEMMVQKTPLAGSGKCPTINTCTTTTKAA